ncbi:MAG: neutral zinc metallopeptidase, partial [Parvibaculum sp.]
MKAGRAGGGISIGAIAIVLIGYFVFGVDPATLIGVVQQGQGGYSTQQAGQQGTPDDERGQFVDTILSSTTDVWSALFATEGKTYRESGPLVLYTQATGTRCGMGQSAMGPFYCPADERIYIDLVFFDELVTRYGAPGEFAQAYVIAHEVGHHVQTVLGTSRQVLAARQNARSEAEANRYSVMQELQADCYAGVWA